MEKTDQKMAGMTTRAIMMRMSITMRVTSSISHLVRRKIRLKGITTNTTTSSSKVLRNILSPVIQNQFLTLSPKIINRHIMMINRISSTSSSSHKFRKDATLDKMGTIIDIHEVA